VYRDEISEYETYQTSTGRETLVADYGLYSEFRNKNFLKRLQTAERKKLADFNTCKLYVLVR
jgi:hypothetical protein